MANLGSIGTGYDTTSGGVKAGRCGNIQKIRLDGELVSTDLTPFSGIDNLDGNPSAPCLRMRVNGVFKFRWTVSSGTRTISVNVMQQVNLSPRPIIVVRANTLIGVNSDVSGGAPNGGSWVTIGPITISPTSNGAVWVELQSLLEGYYDSFWDHIVVT